MSEKSDTFGNPNPERVGNWSLLNKLQHRHIGEIRVEAFPNENCRSFQIRKRLTREQMEWWESPSSMETKPTPAYVRRIFGISGVESISIHQHEIHVTKAKSFAWTEIEDRIVAIIELEIIGE